MRMSGKEFKEFHDTTWPENRVWDECSIWTPDGQNEPVELYDADGGITIPDEVVFTVPEHWQVYDETKTPWMRENLVPYIRKWLKKKDNKTVVVTVPKDKEEALLAFLKTINAKVDK